jgi:hypothetical protein
MLPGSQDAHVVVSILITFCIYLFSVMVCLFFSGHKTSALRVYSSFVILCTYQSRSEESPNASEQAFMHPLTSPAESSILGPKKESSIDREPFAFQ